MLLVDTHYHASLTWWEPVEVFLFHMERAGVSHGVLVQHIGELDNAYIIESTRRFPGRLAAIGLVDLMGEDIEADMDRWFAEGLAGFRMPLPLDRTLQEPHTAWRKAEALGTVVSVVGTTAQFASDAFEAVVAAFPGLPMIIEHQGLLGRLVTAGHGGDNDVPAPPYDEYRKVLSLARYPNVYMKLTGFSEYLPRPKCFHGRAFDLANVPPFIDMSLDAFGADRLMVGTDPSSSCREGYGNVWADLREYLQRYSLDQQAAILGGTAQRLFGFPDA